MVLAFPIARHCLVWKVGNGSKGKIGLDPQVESCQDYKLSDRLIKNLHRGGYFVLNLVVYP
jgi:hypothetical protein